MMQGTRSAAARRFRPQRNLTAPEEHPGLSWAGYPLDGSYSDAADSDGDGLSDYAEVFTYDTDPWLADSDGDGISDGDEVLDATDPQNLNSHVCHLDIIVTNTIEYSCMTNYVYLCNDAAGETNSVFACDGLGGATNMPLSADCGSLRVCAWREAGMYQLDTFDAREYDRALNKGGL